MVIKCLPEHDEDIRDMVHPLSMNISKFLVRGRHEEQPRSHQQLVVMSNSLYQKLSGGLTNGGRCLKAVLPGPLVDLVFLVGPMPSANV